MSEFALLTKDGTKFCMGGIILDESGIRMEYDECGRGVALAKGQRAPSPLWINFELTLVGEMPARAVLPQAMMRQIWAGEHGEYAAQILPLYENDWAEGMTYDRITVEMVLAYLVGVKHGLHLAPVTLRAVA
jgi:hypothetical protein